MTVLKAHFIPIRDVVIFPRMVVPLFIGREQSVKSLLDAVEHDEDICLVCQKDSAELNPKSSHLYRVGVRARILQVFRMPDRTVKVLVEGMERVRFKSFKTSQSVFSCDYEIIVDQVHDKVQAGLLIKTVNNAFKQYGKLTEHVSQDVWSSLKAVTDPSVYMDLVSIHLPLSTQQKQELLEQDDIEKKLEKILLFIRQELEWLKVDKRLQDKVREQIADEQRNYFRREKLKAIQDELEDESHGETGKSEAAQLEEAISQLKASAEVKEKLQLELNRYRRMPPMSSESTMLKNYLDVCLELPWSKRKKLNVDMSKSEDILDSYHHGIDKVKERILETLAVQKRVKKVRGPILCFVGPPGVGKTSLGQAIASACGRSFVRISLGGMRDEAEIRGHRRTYIGAMPGRIIKAMKKAGCANPLILLDEIDKVGSDFRGDPASALLEVLDPEQNQSFSDHYIEFDYDLSDVMFITTANTLNIPDALMDRMEVLQLSGYTDKEKREITETHLLPKVMKQNGIDMDEMKLSSQVTQIIIRQYTREAGVRQLERSLSKLCRYAVRHDLLKKKPLNISKALVQKMLGKPKYMDELILKEPEIGEVHGLAWTSVGGEVLTIEALAATGSGKLQYTGKLGEVMKESIDTAFSVTKARYSELAKEGFFKEHDFHVHVPEGATPKDGPSAGVAITCALMSVVGRKPIMHDVAMTGEITLRGQVLPVGGIKEKVLAAHRMGMKKVVLPFANKKDYEDIPKDVRQDMSFVWVQKVEEVFPEVWH